MMTCHACQNVYAPEHGGVFYHQPNSVPRAIAMLDSTIEEAWNFCSNRCAKAFLEVDQWKQKAL